MTGMENVLAAHWSVSTHTDQKPFVNKCDGCGEVILTWCRNRRRGNEMSASACAGFRWIGQPFSSCEECGQPYWEHTHEDRGTRRDGTHVPFGHTFRRIISQKDKDACKAKWGTP